MTTIPSSKAQERTAAITVVSERVMSKVNSELKN